MLDPRLAKLGQVLEGLLNHWSQIRAEHDPWAAAEGSRAQLEQQIGLPFSWTPNGDPVGYAYLIADVTLGAVHDHMNSVLILLNASPVSFGVQVLARSILESSARAWWLLEPEITAEVRVQRLMTECLHNQRNLQLVEAKVDRNAAKRFGYPEFPDRQASMDMITAKAKLLGWAIIKKPNGFVCVGQSRPSSTQLAIDIIDSPIGAVVYSVTSGATHAMPFALFDALDHQPDPEDPEGHLVSFSYNVEKIELTVSMALVAAIRAIDRQLILCGWREWTWNDYSSHKLDELQRILGVDLSKPKRPC